MIHIRMYSPSLFGYSGKATSGTYHSMKALLTVLVSANLLAGLASARESRPNVILVITDDQGYGDLGCHGNPMIRTPNLDRLHGESVRLTDFHVSPCCTPTRAALMTGRDCVRVGAWGTTWGRSMPRADEVRMAGLFQRLAATGPACSANGTWATTTPSARRTGGSSTSSATAAAAWARRPTTGATTTSTTPTSTTASRRSTPATAPTSGSTKLSRFIEQNREQPFFVYLSTNAPHGPLNVAEKYSEPYVRQGVPANMAKFYGMIDQHRREHGQADEPARRS